MSYANNPDYNETPQSAVRPNTGASRLPVYLLASVSALWALAAIACLIVFLTQGPDATVFIPSKNGSGVAPALLGTLIGAAGSAFVAWSLNRQAKRRAESE